jgi:hypothetical protein
LKSGCGFVIGEAAKTKQLDNLALALVLCGEAFERQIQIQQSRRQLGADKYRFIERNLLRPAASFVTAVGFGVIDEDAAPRQNPIPF